MKERKDLQRMSAAMKRVKSPLKLQTDEPKDKKVVSSTTDVSLQSDLGPDPKKSKMYQQMKKDDAELKKKQKLEKTARQITGTSKEFDTADASKMLKLILANRDGVIPESNIEDEK